MADNCTSSIRSRRGSRAAMTAFRSLLFAVAILTAFPYAYAWGAPEKVGKVLESVGEVRVRHGNEPNTERISRGSYLYVGDIVTTSRESRVKMLMKDESVLTLGRSASLVVREYYVDSSKESRKSVIYLITGKLRALVNKVFGSEGSKFEVQTPTATAGVRGTHFVVLSNLNDETVIYCLEGMVSGANRDLSIVGTVSLGPGDCAQLTEDTAPAGVMDCINGTALFELLNETTIDEMDMTVDKVMIDYAKFEDLNSFTAEDILELLPGRGTQSGERGFGQQADGETDEERKEDLSPLGNMPRGGLGGGGSDLSPDGH